MASKKKLKKKVKELEIENIKLKQEVETLKDALIHVSGNERKKVQEFISYSDWLEKQGLRRLPFNFVEKEGRKVCGQPYAVKYMLEKKQFYKEQE